MTYINLTELIELQIRPGISGPYVLRRRQDRAEAEKIKGTVQRDF
jgi:hypothetical protein